jgi:hypothetical protein
MAQSEGTTTRLAIITVRALTCPPTSSRGRPHERNEFGETDTVRFNNVLIFDHIRHWSPSSARVLPLDCHFFTPPDHTMPRPDGRYTTSVPCLVLRILLRNSQSYSLLTQFLRHIEHIRETRPEHGSHVRNTRTPILFSIPPRGQSNGGLNEGLNGSQIRMGFEWGGWAAACSDRGGDDADGSPPCVQI